jgi:tripartite-type tricarboxylate transporter receptor subunit TctC
MSEMKIYKQLHFFSIAILLACFNHLAFAQNEQYPARQIKMIVPYPPGGFTDILGRLLADRLSARIGQQVIVENKGGGGSTIGTSFVAKSPADGYTILIVAPDLAINQSLIPKLNYSVDDFSPIILAAWSPLVLTVHPSLKINTPKDLIAYARNNPGSLRFASGGNGTGSHLALELFKSKSLVQIIHVPYKGVGPATSDLLGGHVDGMFLQMSVAKRHALNNKLIAIATPGANRVQAMPELPTLSETVLPGFDVVPWFGVVAPHGTPSPIVNRLFVEFQAILSSADVKNSLTEQGAEVVSMAPEAFGRIIHSETSRWAEVIKQLDVKID